MATSFDYTLTDDDAARINAESPSSRTYDAGDTFPAIIVHEYDDDTDDAGLVNAQVFLDGPITHYVQRVNPDDDGTDETPDAENVRSSE